MLMKGTPEPVDIVACARLMVFQVRALQRAHRAGINPHYGQLENLFDTADALERRLSVQDDRSERRCDSPGCGKVVVRNTTDGRGLCLDCAAKAIASALFAGPAAVGR